MEKMEKNRKKWKNWKKRQKGAFFENVKNEKKW